MCGSSTDGTTENTQSTITKVTIVDDKDLLAQGANIRQEGTDLKEPANTTTYTLIDDDAKNCRNIGTDEFKASYVDSGIKHCHLADYSPFEETLDNENLVVDYANGAETTIRFGLIDSTSNAAAVEYFKTGGIIYPIDDTGALQLNNANTPVLVYARQWFLDQWKNANDQNLDMAELVDQFVKAGFDPVSNLDSVKTPSIVNQ